MKKSLLIKLSTLALSICSLLCIGTACKEEHTHSYTETVTSPTCTEQGFTTHTCSCGDSYVDTYVDALGHNFVDYVSNNDATCVENGTETATCSRENCNESDTRTDENSALDHEYGQVAYTWNGNQCTATRICGRDHTHEETETVTAVYQKDTDITCTAPEKGHYKATFTNTAFIEQTTVVNSVENGKELGHLFANYTFNNDAKCGIDGTETAICGNGCGTSDIRAKIGTALEHDFKDYIPDNNATYEEDGTKTATCSREGCNEKHTITDIGTKLESGIAFKTLSVNGTDVYGKVSNTTETFSFIDEVLAVGTAKFVVSLDIYGIQPVSTKTIPLTVGDNKVYVIEMIDDEPTNVYEVVVRRKPMYTVSFNSNGGTNVQSQTIEEDEVAIAPITTRTGYTFDKWDYNFNTPITSNKTITASWTANTNTAYKVEYYLENLENDNYSVLSTATENLMGTTNSTVYAEIKTFEHFTAEQNSVSGVINANGTTVIKVYYQRNEYTVTFNGNGGTLVSGIASQTVKYAGSVVAPTFAKTGYTFDGFDKTNFENISENFTATAQWKTIPYTITYNLNGGTLEENNNPTSYNVETETFSLSSMPRKTNHGFLGWYNGKEKIEKIEKGTTGSINLVAKWEYALIISDGTLEGIQNCAKTTCYEIEIPSYITKIGKQAFYNNNLLTNIVIPNKVTQIGSEAFSGCSSLTKVNYLGTIESWAQIEFGNYTSNPLYYAKNLYINGELVTQANITTATKINVDAFYNCSSLTSVEIPDGVTSIGGSAFSGCSSLTSVTIGNSVTSIGDYAFYNCSSLTSVVIGDSVTSIGNNAFRYCSSLTKVNYLGTIESWAQIEFGNYASNPLYYAKNLYINGELVTQANITTATKINAYAFYNCSSLTSVAIGDSVTSIGEYAFMNCDSLTSVAIGDSVTSIGYEAFYNCSSLTSVEIPDGVTSIGGSAFSGCSSLTSIEIPDSVESIGNYAFSGCSKLQYTVEDNLKYLGNTNNPYLCLADTTSNDITSAIINKNCRIIGSGAFSYCSSLTSIEIPNSVTSIGDRAFSSCSSLTSVTIGNNVTSIGSSAFEGCSSLTSIEIPDSVESIGNYAFSSCPITTITFSDTSTWYRTGNYSNWQNMSGGTATTVTNSSTNATYFTSIYHYYYFYWYKI